jgi:ADP-heptose:LPS heptosyltransferase
MKILVIRFSSIGDIVLTSPVVRCLHEQLKDVEIHFLTKKTYATLVNNNPHIAKAHTLKENIRDSIEDLKAENYTYVVDLHKNTRSRIIIRQLGITSIAYKKLNVRKWLFVNLKINLLPKKHLVDRYFDSLEKLGIKNDGKGLDFFLDIDSHNLPIKLPKEPFIALVIGGTYTTKQPKLKTLLVLINQLKKPLILLGGGDQDASKAAELVDNTASNQVLNTVNKLSILQSAFVISKAHEVITGDTGMMHIAAAFNKPIHVLWGNTHPDFGMYPYPLKSNVVMHKAELKCHPCSKLGYNACPRGHFKCMDHHIPSIVENLHSIQPKQ